MNLLPVADVIASPASGRATWCALHTCASDSVINGQRWRGVFLLADRHDRGRSRLLPTYDRDRQFQVASHLSPPASCDISDISDRAQHLRHFLALMSLMSRLPRWRTIFPPGGRRSVRIGT